MLCSHPILLITRMITDRIGLLSVILPLFIGNIESTFYVIKSNHGNVIHASVFSDYEKELIKMLA